MTSIFAPVPRAKVCQLSQKATPTPKAIALYNIISNDANLCQDHIIASKSICCNNGHDWKFLYTIPVAFSFSSANRVLIYPILNLASAAGTACVGRYLNSWQRYQWHSGASK
jgi:hypothetical protein